MEKIRKGTAKSRGTTRINQRLRRSLVRAASRTRKLTSHLRALSLKAPWNWTAMRAQKPVRLCGGAWAFRGEAGSLDVCADMDGRSLAARRMAGKRGISGGVGSRLE